MYDFLAVIVCWQAHGRSPAIEFPPWQPIPILVSNHSARGRLTINYEYYYYNLILVANFEQCPHHGNDGNLGQNELTRGYLAVCSA